MQHSYYFPKALPQLKKKKAEDKEETQDRIANEFKSVTERQ